MCYSYINNFKKLKGGKSIKTELVIPLQTVYPGTETPVKQGEILGEARIKLRQKPGVIVLHRAVLKDDGLLHEIDPEGKTIETHDNAVVVQYYKTNNT